MEPRCRLLSLLLFLFSLVFCFKTEATKLRPVQSGQSVSPLAQDEVDSLKALFPFVTRETDKIDIYGQLCFTYASTIGNLDVAYQYADSIHFLANKVNNKTGKASATYYYGMLARFDGKFSEAIQYLNQYLNFCRSNKDSTGLANGLFQLAVVQHELGNYDKSLEISYQAKDLYAQLRNSYGIARVFMNIGNLFTSMKKWEDAIVMYKQSLTYFTQLKSDLNARMGKLRVLVNLGNAYAETKQYEKARNFYKQALPICYSVGSKRTAATTLSNIGEVFNALQQYDSALVYHLRALTIREQAAQKDKLAANLIWVGETYLFLKNYPQAKHYLLRAHALAYEFRTKPILRDVYQKLALLYSTQHYFEKALEYQQLYATLKDSVLNEETAQRLSELQTKYQTEEKDKQIAILAKEKQVRQKEAQRQALQQKALLGGLFLITIIALLIIFLLRQRLKNQKLVMAKNQEIKESNLKRQMSELEMKALRAQMNPHFIFNCMNSINRLILDEDTNRASRYLVKLSKLIRLILENSERSSVSLENELTMLDAYLQLESLRFKGRISYEFRVDDAIDQENTFLPPMVLQPFVENAIWHGLMHKEKNEPGFISISITEEADSLTCVIEDNGVGREMATILEKKSIIGRKSMGLQITEERLKILNKDKMDKLIYITDLKDSLNQALGTRVDIHVPLG
ncbi:tetratricopeptide repeat protein [Adhaeribacter radiodurans]|uniref:Tetratricopeptide repeat protein n=1 Tax=Adhaeribacter radiodurans TaxID=2745197 RepID=A0A7L7L9S4_9BACT|nr:tetratricopeptide repeat protein [Adhaeribacter radiodurans]QMU29285.1 tetratricopeptide repeat protein [Adhaeribacter radiodurans]